jgi:cytochrome c1
MEDLHMGLWIIIVLVLIVLFFVLVKRGWGNPIEVGTQVMIIFILLLVLIPALKRAKQRNIDKDNAKTSLPHE